MSEQQPPPATGDPVGYPPPPPAQPQEAQQGQPPVGQPAYAPPVPQGSGELGQVRGTGLCILLFVVTFGIYGIVYFYKVHEEMKRHSGRGIGGAIALILALFVSIVLAYLTPMEVGELRKSRGQQERVSGLTGLWYFPGIFILVGPIIWFVKMNGALNDYWVSQGAQA